MGERREDYSFFVGDDADFDAYLAKMARPRTWGDELSLRAACDAAEARVAELKASAD